MPSQTKSKSNRSARHSTPLSSSTETSSVPVRPPTLTPTRTPTPAPTGDLPYLGTSLASLLVPTDVTIEGLIDESGFNSNNPPSASALRALYDGILSKVLVHVNARGNACDRSMRELARHRKERQGAERDAEERKRHDEERRKRKSASTTPLKRERDIVQDETRPPAVGAHGLARQDGGVTEQEPPASDVPHQPAPAEAEVTAAVDVDGEEEDEKTETEHIAHQPAPAITVAQYQNFGEDPTKFNDASRYGIPELHHDMSEEEKKQILSVSTYPHDDLLHLTAGTPADHDYSIAKPANQVSFTSFISFVEPYVKSLSEEDVAFLKERSDRVQPFMIPTPGPLHYRQVWAKEDGGIIPRPPQDSRLPPNEARGSIDDMNDDVAMTEEVSSGPLLSRLLAAFRHEPVAVTDAAPDTGASTDGGDTVMRDGDDDTDGTTFRPASQFPELSNAVKINRPYASLEQRMLGELRHHGLLGPDAVPEYEGQFDDEVSERLRLLQTELRQVSVENAARKARVLELTEERMAMQEYATIADDLDNQINAAYTKRNRTMNRPKKGTAKSRPGQSAGGAGGLGAGVGRNVVSEGVRMLMERRLQWKELIGPVVDFGQKGIPVETVFDPQTMDRLVRQEGEMAAAGDEP